MNNTDVAQLSIKIALDPNLHSFQSIIVSHVQRLGRGGDIDKEATL